MIDPADHSSDERTAGADEDESTKDDALPGRPWYDGTAFGTGDCGVSHRVAAGASRSPAVEFTRTATGAIAYDERPAVLRDNVGYPTEAGERTTVADGGAIDHGLAEEPTVVTIEPRSPARAFAREFDPNGSSSGWSTPRESRSRTPEPLSWKATVY